MDSTAGIQVGQWVRLFVNDKSTAGSSRALRRRRLLAPTPPAGPPASASGARRPPPRRSSSPPPPPPFLRLLPTTVPPRVAAHPAYQAALEGAALAGEPGAGLTPAQAAAADAAWAAYNRPPSKVSAAAAKGTFVYWCAACAAPCGQGAAVGDPAAGLGAGGSAVAALGMGCACRSLPSAAQMLATAAPQAPL